MRSTSGFILCLLIFFVCIFLMGDGFGAGPAGIRLVLVSELPLPVREAVAQLSKDGIIRSLVADESEGKTKYAVEIDKNDGQHVSRLLDSRGDSVLAEAAVRADLDQIKDLILRVDKIPVQDAKHISTGLKTSIETKNGSRFEHTIDSEETTNQFETLVAFDPLADVLWPDL